MLVLCCQFFLQVGIGKPNILGTKLSYANLDAYVLNIL